MRESAVVIPPPITMQTFLRHNRIPHRNFPTTRLPLAYIFLTTTHPALHAQRYSCNYAKQRRGYLGSYDVSINFSIHIDPLFMSSYWYDKTRLLYLRRTFLIAGFTSLLKVSAECFRLNLQIMPTGPPCKAKVPGSSCGFHYAVGHGTLHHAYQCTPDFPLIQELMEAVTATFCLALTLPQSSSPALTIEGKALQALLPNT